MVKILKSKWSRGVVHAVLPLGYFCLLLGGIASLIVPPNSISTTTSTFLSLVWGVFIIAGSLMGIFGTVTGRPGVEMVGTPLLFFAIMVYGIVLLVRQWAIPGLASNGTVVAWLVIGLCILGVLARFINLILTAKRWELLR